VCNAAETLLVHEDVADEFLPKLFAEFKSRSVTVHGDEKMQAHADSVGVNWAPVSDEDWAAEYYSMDIAAGVVPSVEAAVEHILTWSSGSHRSNRVQQCTAIAYFTSAVDSAAVMVNASTRFTDGGEFGFGAEIGISTQKLHARGPMGLTELTTTTSSSRAMARYESNDSTILPVVGPVGLGKDQSEGVTWTFQSQRE